LQPWETFLMGKNASTVLKIVHWLSVGLLQVYDTAVVINRFIM
jgi:hypothetical protein